MPRWFLWTHLTILSLLLGGCLNLEQEDQYAKCELDISNLEGTYISLKGGGSGSDVPDPYARVKFYTEDGKKKAMYTAGRLAPNNPATNKYEYEHRSTSEDGEAMYVINMFADKSRQRIERLKKDNRRLDVKFEGRIYVKVNKKRCSLTIGDFYVTYVKGEETIDSNPTGTRTYLRSKEELGFVHCDEVRQLMPFAMDDPNWDKDAPLDVKTGLFAKEPAWFHYIEKNYDGSKSEIREKQHKAGVMAEDGCSYDFELWAKDRRVAASQKVAVEPKENGFLHWKVQHAFDKSSADGIFVEMHRYKTCAEGGRTLVGNACTVVWPEPERTAEEKAEAESEAAKKK
ncbi:MAG TPA: hypothetical protein DIU15_19140 [Deltaproteobacteria bacterium]|nr:hypothetical protein [Deltaproteobacteria bacterium]HCP48162.1 hypothetical protein [Deltaproteobacteria bacterium]|tara:strand:- start:11 stop:1039 length:1029 start_codon:yes stop_codon:yes gene_type:complete